MNQPTKLTITEMVADIESRLTVGPDADTAIAPSGESYATFHVGIPTGERHDCCHHDIEAELIAALWGILTTYKTDVSRLGGKFIRWRKRPVIEKAPGRHSIYCRVLISAQPESVSEIVREPLIVPVPEACDKIHIITMGYHGAESGQFYDEYGRLTVPPKLPWWKVP